MKGKRKGLLLGVMLVLLTFCAGSLSVQAATTTTTKAATAKKKNGPVKENGKRYYYVNGKKVVNAWKTVNKKKYYYGADGAAKTGWYSIGNKSYYFDSKGVLKKSKSMDKTLLSKMDAALKKSVKAKDSNSVALKKLFNYMSSGKVYGYARAMGFKGQKGWDYTYAKELLTKKKGSCYHYAAAFAVLAKRFTGYPVRICWGTGKVFSSKWQAHGWVEIKINGTWYTFDTNAAQFSQLRKGKWYMQKRSAMEGKIYKTQKYVNVEL